MTNPPPRTGDAARLLIEELEAVCAEEARIRSEARAATLRRRRLITALNAVLTDLPKNEADWIRERKLRATQAEALAGAREQKSQYAAILGYLARHSLEEIRVAEIAAYLQRAGFTALKPSYVSDTLRRFERNGLVLKVAHGRYRVNEAHSRVVDAQLDWLEAEIRKDRQRDRAAVARHFRQAARR